MLIHWKYFIHNSSLLSLFVNDLKFRFKSILILILLFNLPGLASVVGFVVHIVTCFNGLLSFGGVLFWSHTAMSRNGLFTAPQTTIEKLKISTIISWDIHFDCLCWLRYFWNSGWLNRTFLVFTIFI